MKGFYLVGCIVGTVVPYAALLSWFGEFGFSIPLIFEHINSTKIGLFAWLDVLISAVVLIGFILYDSKKIGFTQAWKPILGTCLVGVSLGLPLYLLLREMHQETQIALQSTS
ncbi:conserved hypothetical protein [Vibrio nigripulchritudo MADA3029]|uniref:DUF2834 domain-containing protein n=2 Tax=Vibrio nigripulchritudo TaxID=28173 RepID=U4K7S9_9VIBR|nr:DUF2834 domain-containing protein [Vibrio nigripulchritudo]EGU59957.1 hypothetical protein VINI7043_10155 [Vibrio nigripulchritudo ATCC 27043]KJY69166.1 hypothetical protein TW74_25305 [Vibrio nigripulchritudo]CCN38142.1 conserved hypothetical protein [Vibrio nigripulchritudo AM115]CCN39608.1 conserved hypothetical protein [Vibrio nigripulchritudo FTn2]CCN47731.1 conserved hypothetical protein [Vibrio nigripulchritudo MADA3020]